MSAPARNAMRRGWCPSTLRPMETGDGWLVRLHPPGATLSPLQLGRIAALAAAHGNGLIEVSARANLQLRGVTPTSHPRLVAALTAERLVDEHEGDGPQRITLASPLAGFGSVPPINAHGLAAAIEAAARGITGLPAKFSVVVDDGGPSGLDEFSADLRLVATDPGLLVLQLAEGTWYGPVAEPRAAGLVATLLGRFAALRRENPTLRRMRDLTDASRDHLAALPRAPAPRPRPAPRRVGLFAGETGTALSLGLPFGRCDAAAVAALAAALESASVTIRPSPWRGLVIGGLASEAAPALMALAQAHGLITSDDDPRLSIQACAGSPLCARGQAPAAADAARLAQDLGDRLRGQVLHVSGCAKGCAHPGPAALTLVGARGGYGVVLDGRADDEPLMVLDLPALRARLQPDGDWRAQLAAGDARRDH